MADDDDLERLRAWAEVMDDSSYYELLGLLEIADEAAIRDAFHRFSLAFHPDMHRGQRREVTELAARIFHRGTEAYRVLSDPELRLRYDMGLAKGQLRFSVRHSTRPPRAGDRPAPLHELCRSAAATLLAQKAERHLAAGEMREAHELLVRAIEAEGGTNPALAERIDALELLVYAMGDD